MTSAVVLLSGGLDSTTLLHVVKKQLATPDVYVVTFFYGQKHAREIEMARAQAASVGVKEHKEIDLSFFAGLAGGKSALTNPAIDIPALAALNQEQRAQPPTYVPNRNMIFLSIAAAYAEALGVWDVFYGAHKQDAYGYWDCSVDFVEGMNRLLKQNRGKPVRVHAPFAAKSKSEVVRIGCELGVDYEQTWTCYRGGDKPCGVCPSCVERIAAFREVSALKSAADGR